jgi:uncharacterized protein involved in copper resistance
MAAAQQAFTFQKVRRRESCSLLPFRGMYRSDDEEWLGLRLMRTVLAVLLAVCMAVFPVAIRQAVASTGHSHAPGTHAHEALDGTAHADVSAPHEDDTLEHEHAASHGQDEGSSSSCCGTTTCHAFQVSSSPALGARLPLIGVVQVACDHQVPSVFPGRLDRPPRTA